MVTIVSLTVLPLISHSTSHIADEIIKVELGYTKNIEASFIELKSISGIKHSFVFDLNEQKSFLYSQSGEKTLEVKFGSTYIKLSKGQKTTNLSGVTGNGDYLAGVIGRDSLHGMSIRFSLLNPGLELSEYFPETSNSIELPLEVLRNGFVRTTLLVDGQKKAIGLTNFNVPSWRKESLKTIGNVRINNEIAFPVWYSNLNYIGHPYLSIYDMGVSWIQFDFKRKKIFCKLLEGSERAEFLVKRFFFRSVNLDDDGFLSISETDEKLGGKIPCASIVNGRAKLRSIAGFPVSQLFKDLENEDFNGIASWLDKRNDPYEVEFFTPDYPHEIKPQLVNGGL